VATAPAATTRATGNGWNVLLLTIDTLRADHLGAYGYAKETSPHIDALARESTVFDQAYTFWPKTRGSFVMMMTGRRPSQNGYGKTHPVLLGFNPTLAGVLKAAGYRTAAVVDNPNVAAQYGYNAGFETYRETWEEKALATEMDRTRAITADGVKFLREAPAERPFFLWLHYVNPHAPYTPPAPFDRAFLDESVARSRRLPVVPGYHGGVARQWAVPGQDRLGYYVAQYDGEIAAVDAEVGQVLDALAASPSRDRTLVVLTTDHGESLGEHDYFFDHGENLFDPSMRIPLVVRLPGAAVGRRTDVLASTLDLLPTVLDAVKVSYPPDLAGASLLPAVTGGPGPPRDRLFGQNERNLTATWDARFKLAVAPGDGGDDRRALYDRKADPGETKDVSRAHPERFRVDRRELELFLDRDGRERRSAEALVQGAPSVSGPTAAACEKLRSLGYVDRCP
jgi:arylsulfatase A-like enzyme